MKRIEETKLANVSGGITCSNYLKVLAYLAQTNPAQHNAVYELFAPPSQGGQGYELQCTPD